MARVANRGLTEAEAKRFYDRHGSKLEWSDAFEERAKRLAFSWVEPRPGDRVLELGVGCGHFQPYALERVGPAGLVAGFDLSETMLRLTKDRAPAACLVRASAAHLPFRAESFDWAFSSYVLDLLPTQVIEAALRGLHEALRPGGSLVLCSLTEGHSALERTFMALWKRIHRLAPERLGGCRPLRLAPLVQAAGFEVVRREHVGQLGMPSEVLLARR